MAEIPFHTARLVLFRMYRDIENVWYCMIFLLTLYWVLFGTAFESYFCERERGTSATRRPVCGAHADSCAIASRDAFCGIGSSDVNTKSANTCPGARKRRRACTRDVRVVSVRVREESKPRPAALGSCVGAPLSTTV